MNERKYVERERDIGEMMNLKQLTNRMIYIYLSETLQNSKPTKCTITEV